MSSQDVGSVYQVYVVAVNRAGETDSDTILFTLASAPSTPDVPTSTSDGKELTVIMTAPSDGGASISSYELQLDFDDGNGFVTVVGGDELHTQTLTYTIDDEDLIVGKRYRTRYRAKNQVGWSDWSPIGY